MHRHIPAGSARLAAVERWLGENADRLERLEELLLGRKDESPAVDTATGQPPYSIADWCKRAGVGKSTYYLEQREGRGPKTIRVRGRTLITEAPTAYLERRRREQARETEDAEAADAAP
jgi:hypothetical protein